MNLEMMNESSKRHPKLSLIFTPNCLSKTSVTRIFVFYFSLKISRKTYHRIRLFPWILNCFSPAFAISKRYYNNNCLCTTEDDVLANYQFSPLFSRWNYALVLVLKGKLNSVRAWIFFLHKRNREAEVDKTVVLLKKQTNKNKKGKLGWHFAYLQNFWQILKWQPRKVPATFPANSSQTTDVYINKPICWQYLAHVVLIDSSCASLMLSGGTFFKAS